MAAEITESEDLGPMSSINVTPFVDVVLVLLVIFMLTAPALVKDSIGVKLPKAVSADKTASESLGVVITKQGQILVNGQLSDDLSLKDQVQQTIAKNPEAQAMISADVEARHGDVVHVIDVIKSAGLSRFAIQIER